MRSARACCHRGRAMSGLCAGALCAMLVGLPGVARAVGERSEIRFPYYAIAHAAGTLVEDPAATTSHGVTLQSLTPGTRYYYRVQSEDGSGTATTKVASFVAAETPGAGGCQAPLALLVLPAAWRRWARRPARTDVQGAHIRP